MLKCSVFAVRCILHHTRTVYYLCLRTADKRRAQDIVTLQILSSSVRWVSGAGLSTDVHTGLSDRAPQTHSQSCHRASPVLSGCVPGAINLLGGESSALSEALSALDSVLLQHVCQYITLLRVPSALTSDSVPASEIYCRSTPLQNMMLQLPCLTIWME